MMKKQKTQRTGCTHNLHRRLTNGGLGPNRVQYWPLLSQQLAHCPTNLRKRDSEERLYVAPLRPRRVYTPR